MRKLSEHKESEPKDVSETQGVKKQKRNNNHKAKGGERKERQKKNFLRKQSEVERNFLTGQPMNLLVYKEAILFINAQGEDLLSTIISLLHKFEDVVLDEKPPELPPIG